MQMLEIKMNIQKKYISKFVLVSSITLALGTGAAQAAINTYTNGNFTMLDGIGGSSGGTNDVTAVWNDATNNATVNGTSFNMTISSPTPFSGNLWTAHDIRVFDPGTYIFNSSCTVAEIQAGTAPGACAAGTPDLTMTVAAGQVGVHMLFDWSIDTNIDVAIVWDQNAAWTDPDGPCNNPFLCTKINDLYLGPAGPSPDSTANWLLISTDDDGDGFNGIPMPDGTFTGFNANFNFGVGGTVDSVSSVEGNVDDVSLVSGAGCSITSTDISLQERGDLWLIIGFLITLGIIVNRRKRLS